jgi:hypothetical protein
VEEDEVFQQEDAQPYFTSFVQNALNEKLPASQVPGFNTFQFSFLGYIEVQSMESLDMLRVLKH